MNPLPQVRHRAGLECAEAGKEKARALRGLPPSRSLPPQAGEGRSCRREPVPIALPQRCADGRRDRRIYGAPYGIRTRVLALRGPRPGPLDEGSGVSPGRRRLDGRPARRSEEATAELTSLMRIAYAVLCW